MMNERNSDSYEYPEKKQYSYNNLYSSSDLLQNPQNQYAGEQSLYGTKEDNYSMAGDFYNTTSEMESSQSYSLQLPNTSKFICNRNISSIYDTNQFDENYNEDLLSNDRDENEEKTERKKLTFTQFFSKFIKQQKLFKPAQKFYLFMDQVFDFDYFTNYSNKESYLKERQEIQQHKDMRFINRVTHRLDNKFIEVDMEFFPTSVDNIDYVIHILKSFGNKDLLKFISDLQIFWDKIQICKQQIIQQRDDPLFRLHAERRKQTSCIEFQKLTSEIPQDKLIFYLRTSINYEKQLFESDKAGYSPALYEILDINSYSFKNYLQTYGYYDPRTSIYKLEQCFQRALSSISFLTSTYSFNCQQFGNIQLEIRSIDGFIFPVQSSAVLYNLDYDYDKSNNLSFSFKDLLLIFEFQFTDPSIHKNFKIYRQQNQYELSKPVTIYSDDFFDDQVDFKKTEFFQKYYDDQIENLVAKGNKWFKRCGYTDIPIKKKRKVSQEQEEINL